MESKGVPDRNKIVLYFRFLPAYIHPTNQKGTMNILFVEDNPADVLLLRHLFAQQGFQGTFQVVSDGAAAIEYLVKAAKGAKSEFPDIVILDLSLPKKDGREVLREIRGQEQWNSLPIIVLSSSKNNGDIMNAYSHGANGYEVKPSNLPEFRSLVIKLLTLEFPRLSPAKKANIG
jgi:CheY-like chemotaxis protein